MLGNKGQYFTRWLGDIIIIALAILILVYLPKYVNLSGEPGALSITTGILVYLVPIVLLLVVLFFLISNIYYTIIKMRYAGEKFRKFKSNRRDHRFRR